ncbi:hypothetical protein D3C74_476330 [compost metagenome]
MGASILVRQAPVLPACFSAAEAGLDFAENGGPVRGGLPLQRGKIRSVKDARHSRDRQHFPRP